MLLFCFVFFFSSHAHAIILSMAAVTLFSIAVNIMFLIYLWKQKKTQPQQCNTVPNYSSLVDIMLTSGDEDDEEED